MAQLRILRYTRSNYFFEQHRRSRQFRATKTVEHLIKALPAILRAGGNSEEVVEAAAVAAWKHVAGTPLSKHAVATKLTSGTLEVAVSDTIWQKQLASMRKPLRQRLNALLGQPLISRLEFRIDPAALKPGETAIPVGQSIEPNETNLSLELWAAANAIQDKRLRKIFLATVAGRLQSETN